MIFTSIANAYPKEHLQECILGAKRSPIVLGVPHQEIVDWCNCTLELIMDEGMKDSNAGGYCGQKYLK